MPLTRAERRQVDRAEDEIVGFCREVSDFIAGERSRPGVAELAAAFKAIDRYAAVARAKPKAQLRPGVDVRTALGDLGENLDGSNCPVDLVRRIDQALATIP